MKGYIYIDPVVVLLEEKEEFLAQFREGEIQTDGSVWNVDVTKINPRDLHITRDSFRMYRVDGTEIKLKFKHLHQSVIY